MHTQLSARESANVLDYISQNQSEFSGKGVDKAAKILFEKGITHRQINGSYLRKILSDPQDKHLLELIRKKSWSKKEKGGMSLGQRVTRIELFLEQLAARSTHTVSGKLYKEVFNEQENK